MHTCPKCKECKFYEPFGETSRERYGRHGDCRRNPPVIIERIVTASDRERPEIYLLQGHWPFTSDGDWCGEFEYRNPEHIGEISPRDNLRTATSRFELGFIKAVLQECDDNMSEAARRIGLERSHLYRKIKSLNSLIG